MLLNLQRCTTQWRRKHHNTDDVSFFSFIKITQNNMYTGGATAPLAPPPFLRLWYYLNKAFWKSYQQTKWSYQQNKDIFEISTET